MAASIKKNLYHMLRGSKEAFLSPHFSFFSSSEDDLQANLSSSFHIYICKRPVAALGGGNLSLKREKSEYKGVGKVSGQILKHF